MLDVMQDGWAAALPKALISLIWRGLTYLQQLQLFASDKRSFVVDGKHKRKMIEVSKRFSLQEFSDIAAYIKSQPD